MTGMTDEQALAWWRTLPADVREQVDRRLREVRTIEAIQLLRAADTHGLGVGLRQAIGIVNERHRALDLPSERAPGTS